jgi:hypothetical protein
LLTSVFLEHFGAAVKFNKSCRIYDNPLPVIIAIAVKLVNFADQTYPTDEVISVEKSKPYKNESNCEKVFISEVRQQLLPQILKKDYYSVHGAKLYKKAGGFLGAGLNLSTKNLKI